MQRFQLRQDPGEQKGTAGRLHGQIQNPDVLCADVGQLPLERFIELLHPDSVRDIALPGIGQHIAVPDPAKELHAELLLQPDQEFAQSRLAQIQGLGSPGDALMLRDRKNVIDLPQLHTRPSFFTRHRPLPSDESSAGCFYCNRETPKLQAADLYNRPTHGAAETAFDKNIHYSA